MADVRVNVDTEGAGDYATMNLALIGEAQDLVTNTTTLYFDGSGATSDGIFSVTGYTTNSTYRIIINGDNTGSEWDGTKYTNEYVGNYLFSGVINIAEAYTELHNLQVSVTENGQVGAGRCIQNSAGGEESLIVDSCIIRGLGTYGDGIHLARYGTNNSIIKNNIIYGFTGGNAINIQAGAASYNNYAYFNNAYNNATGIRNGGGGNAVFKNNISFTNTDDFDSSSSGTTTIDYCASDDGDGTNAITGLTWADQFTDYTNYDFSLKSGNSLQGSGVSVSGITVDMIDTTRATPPSAGALEEIIAGTTTNPMFFDNSGIMTGVL